MYRTLALGTAASHLFVSPSHGACMIGCTRMHTCDLGLQRNRLRHNFHITPALAPERPAGWSRSKRIAQLSCETRSVPCHTFQWRCHLVSLARYLPRRGRWGIACCCSCPFVAIACLKHVFVVSSFCKQSLQASTARQVELLQGRGREARHQS